MAVNEDGVLATGGDNGSMWYWDWKSGHNFQQDQSIVQPGEARTAVSFVHSKTKQTQKEGCSVSDGFLSHGCSWVSFPRLSLCRSRTVSVEFIICRFSTGLLASGLRVMLMAAAGFGVFSAFARRGSKAVSLV